MKKTLTFFLCLSILFLSNATRTAKAAVGLPTANEDSVLFYDSFENGMAAWTCNDANSDGYCWTDSLYTGSSYAHSGNYCASSLSYDSWDVGAIRPDNWLISQAITIPATGSATLSWYMRASNSYYIYEYISVYISTSNNIADMTAPIYSGLLTSATYTKLEFDISAFLGETVYIAFRHHNCYDEYALLLDDVSVTHSSNPPCAAPLSLTAQSDTTFATISWIGTASSYVVTLFDANDNVVYSTTTASNSIVLSNLQILTSYHVQVAPTCNSSRSASIDFQTTIPYLPIVYVKPDANGSGRSWSDALGDLNTATRYASTIESIYGENCDVWVAAGTYRPTTYIYIVSKINVFGGFAGNEPPDYNPDLRNLDDHRSIIDGSNLTNRYYLLRQDYAADSLTRWDGFTITQSPGGGVSMSGNCILSNCVIRNNHGDSYGGILSNGNYGPNLIDHCTIEGNTSTTTYYNYCTAGACLYYNTTMRNCLVVNNTSASPTGGIYAGSNCLIDHCTIVGNTSSSSSCITPGIYLNSYSATLSNSIVWGNRAPNISEGTTAEQVHINSGTVNYCAVEGGVSGTECITLSSQNNGTDPTEQYPYFAQIEDNNYTLTEGSACIDAGSPTSESLTDLLGNPRRYGDATDIGCYEFQDQSFCPRPFNVAVTYIGTTSALVSWQHPEGHESATTTIEYKTEAQNDWTSIANLSGDNYILYNLSDNTTYLLRVKIDCSPTESSSYSKEKRFTTKRTDNNGDSIIIVGDTLASNKNYLPINNYYNYSYTQQIFTPSDLGYSNGDILSVSFQYNYNTPITRNIILYLGHTTQSTLTSYSNYIPAEDLQRCYANEVTFSSGWVTITLQQPFNYNGNDNLVLAVVDSTGSYVSTYNRFRCTNTTDPMSLYYYSDQYILTPNNPNIATSKGSLNYRNTIKINYATFDCPHPDIIVNEIQTTSARITAVGTGNYQIEYAPTGSQDYITVGTTAGSYILSGLHPYANYNLRVRTICEEDVSAWKYVPFRTAVPHYDHIHVAPQSTGLADGSTWSNATSDLNWAITVAANNAENRPDIWLKEGTYTDPNTYTLLDGVALYGGFEGNEPTDYDLSQRNPAVHPTILDGEHQRQVASLSSGSCLLDGLTFARGGANSNNSVGSLLDARSTNSIIRNCTFIDDSSRTYSIYITGNPDGAKAIIDRCTFRNNNSRQYLINLTYCQISNSLIANNVSSYSTLYSNNNTIIENCDFVRNIVQNALPIVYNSSSSCLMNNSIVWGNSTTATYSVQSSTYYNLITNCAIQGGISGLGTNNIPLHKDNLGIFAPNFVHPTTEAGPTNEQGDWQLAAGSFCINRAATLLLPMSQIDLAGNARLQNDTLDLGCYESAHYGRPLPSYSDSIIYVAEGGNGTRDGSSWSDAIDNLGSAVEIANLYKYKIWVAQGTYVGDTSLSSAFTIQAGVQLFGGFSGNEPPSYDLSRRDLSRHASILDGQNMQRVVNVTGDYNSTTKLDGFTIQNGNTSSENGGGIYAQQYVTLRNITLRDNHAYYYGGGAYLSYYSTFVNGTVAYNTSQYNGGGIYANSYNLIENTTFAHNSSSSSGGGFYGASQDTLRNCLIYRNTSQCDGSGAYTYYTTILNTTIANNTINNTASYYYGGLYAYYSSVANSIVWGNKRGLLPNNFRPEGNVTVSHCAFEEGDTTGASIVLASSNDGYSSSQFFVRFMDPSNDDYHLHVSSPCVDYGDTNVTMTAEDLDGQPRRYGNSVDLGPYEVQETSTCPTVQGLAISNVSSTSAIATWHPTSSATSFVVTYGISGESDTSIIVADTSTLLSGLRINRNYTVRVSALCGNDRSVYSIPATFLTKCDSATLTPLSEIENLIPASNDIVYAEYCDFSWSSLPMATSYDFYLWEEGDSEPPTPTLGNRTLAGINAYRLPHYDHGKNYHWKVVAWNECIHQESPVQTFRTNYLPNLHVTSLDHSTPVANQTITVQWTVSNDGEGNTPPGESWNDYIWISGVNEIGGGFLYNVDELLLATVPNLSALNAGESYTNSAQVTIPSGYIGNYYLFVMCDQHNAVAIDYSPTGDTLPPIPYAPSLSGVPYPYLVSSNSGYPAEYVWSRISESVETDNFYYKLTTILPPPSPDLQVTHISHPTNAFSNSDITIQWTVTNNGEASTVASRWADALYISTEQVFNLATATHLATVVYDSLLLPISGSYTQQASVHIPLPYMGPYYIFVATDVNDNVYEGLLDGNNTSPSSQALNVTLSPTADLAVSRIATASDSLSDNVSHSLTYSVCNIGAAATESDSWIDALYIQGDSVFNPITAHKLCSCYHYGAIPPDSAYTESVTFTLPPNLDATCYLFVETDVRNEIFEYQGEDNNRLRTSTPIVICKPDLIGNIDAIPDTINANQEQEVTWHISNLGTGTMTQRNIKSEFLLNGQPCYTISSNIALLPGETYHHTSLLKLPCSAQTSNSISFRVDSDNKVDEGLGENNNTSDNRQVKVVAPDLYTTQVMMDADLWSGEPTAVSWTIHNAGNGSIDNPVSMIFYLNQSPSGYQAADSIGAATLTTQLTPGDSIQQNATLRLPNGVFGNCYLHLVVNADNNLCEGVNQHANHTVSMAYNVQLSPYPDLVADQVEVDDTMTVGVTSALSYRLRNQGVARLNGEVTMNYYLSHTSTLTTSNATLLHSERKQIDLAVGAIEQIHTAVVLPTTENAGRAYLYVVVDANDNFYEYTGETNNVSAGSPTIVKIYPIDLMASAISGPTTVEWGERVTYQMTVVNNSPVATIAPRWNDALFLSTDEVLQSSDTRLGQTQHQQTVNPGESYTTQFSFTVPFGAAETAQLIGVTDINLQNSDINTLNNTFVKEINVLSVPTPDLELLQITLLEEQVTSGQEVRLAYTVRNTGTVPITNGAWNDKVFMQTAANQGEIEIGSQSHTRMNVAAGSVYSDTLRMTVPLPINGNLNLRFSVNAGNVLFESNRANNDSSRTVAVAIPLPGDLIVGNIRHSDTVTSGVTMETSWEVVNQGANGLSGNGLRSLVYLSTDTLFDARDKKIGDATTQGVSLAPGGRLSQSASLRISGVAEGNYYIIVKTDVANAFNETNNTNNSSCSLTPFRLQVKALPFNTTVNDMLTNDLANDYKITVGDETHETVRISLASSDSARGAVNNIYVSHNAIGDNMNYTYSTNGQSTGNPELYIPSTESGYYGVNVYGSTPAGTQQQTAIQAEVLPFELLGCSPAYGGNTGMTTVEITGSRFRPDMKVRLEKDSTYIECDTLIYDSYYRVFARFNLTGRDTGSYSLTALNYCEGEAQMERAFRVAPGRGDDLLTNVVFPNAPRPNRNIVLMLEFVNQGNTDIENAVVRITSHGGSRIALTPEGLEEGKMVLDVPLSVEGEVPGLIRPGSYGTINIHCFTSGTLLFQVERIDN